MLTHSSFFQRCKSRCEHLTVLYPATFTLLLVFLLSFFPLTSFSSESQKTYQATTIDECIDEKACVKYVFLHETIKDYDKLKDQNDSGFHLQRWKGPLYIEIMGVDQNQRKEVEAFAWNAKKYVDQVAPYFSHPIEFSNGKQKINTLFVYGENLSENIKRFDKILKPEFFEMLKNFRSDQSKVIKLSNRGIHYNGVILIEKERAEQGCFFGLLSDYIGIGAAPSDMFDLSDYNDCEPSRLHKVILTILQHRKMKPEMNLSEVEKAFDTVYEELEKKAASTKRELSDFIKMAQKYKEEQMVMKGSK